MQIMHAGCCWLMVVVILFTVKYTVKVKGLSDLDYVCELHVTNSNSMHKHCDLESPVVLGRCNPATMYNMKFKLL